MQNSSVEGTKNTVKNGLSVGRKHFDLKRPLVMGILNITPDSFYDGSRIESEESLIERVKEMLMDGADIIDIGGYSTRPGANAITEAEELERILPAIRVISVHFPNALISIDTFRSKVADAAIQAGAHMINDVSGFIIEPNIVDVAAKHDVPYILMHMRGTPETMMDNTSYTNLVEDIKSYFTVKCELLLSKGVKQVIIDPGFGFSKTVEQNHNLLQNLEQFHELQLPILLGISRKSMIYKKLGITPAESLKGTIGLNAIGLSKGANILRVHDVKEARELIDLLF